MTFLGGEIGRITYSSIIESIWIINLGLLNSKIVFSYKVFIIVIVILLASSIKLGKMFS